MIEPVQVLDEAAQAVMRGHLREVPVEALVVLPLDELPELDALEDELLSGVRPHPGEEHPAVCEFLPVVAGHFVDQRAFAMNDLVVAEHENEMLVKGIEHREGDLALVESAVNRILADVAQAVVHPAHGPLEAESQPAGVGGTRDSWPGGGLLGDHGHARESLIANLIAAFQKTDRVEVFPPAKAVRNPLAGFARVIEVKHRRHGIHAQAVDVVFIKPEKRVADQEIFHLVAAVVEDERAPVLMLAEAWILVFVKRAAIESSKAVGILRKMSGHPIENHADVGLVTAVHEISKLVGVSEATGRRVVVHHLVAPRPVEGMLHHGH